MISKTRRGVSLIEAAASTILLGVVFTTAVQLAGWSAAMHRSAQRKRCALEAAAGVLDRFSVRKWNTITQADADGVAIPAELVQSLTAPKLTVAVVEEAEEPPAKKINVDVAWSERSDAPNQHVRLTTWVFQRGASK